MSVFNNPLEWAKEMNRLMGTGEINSKNYLTDCANAVIYVKETAEENVRLKEQLADLWAFVKAWEEWDENFFYDETATNKLKALRNNLKKWEGKI